MPKLTPRNCRWPCPQCGKLFASGWGFNSHSRWCVGAEGTPDAQADVAQDGGEQWNGFEAQSDAEEGSEDMVQDDGDEPRHSIEDHFSRMEELGTLELDHVKQYSQWGKVPLKDKDVEICRFLRSNEVGGGSSDGKSTAMLLYARSLGGRGELLPKTMKTCWAKVDRVRSS